MNLLEDEENSEKDVVPQNDFVAKAAIGYNGNIALMQTKYLKNMIKGSRANDMSLLELVFYSNVFVFGLAAIVATALSQWEPKRKQVIPDHVLFSKSVNMDEIEIATYQDENISIASSTRKENKKTIKKTLDKILKKDNSAKVSLMSA